MNNAPYLSSRSSTASGAVGSLASMAVAPSPSSLAASRASATVTASGFSSRTCLPASRAWASAALCVPGGVVMDTRSTSMRATSCARSVQAKGMSEQQMGKGGECK